MVSGIGIDSVEIARFKQWHLFSDERLCKIFSRQEIVYSKAEPNLSAQRFAVRFAAREAFFKALGHVVSTSIPFLTVCRSVQLIRDKRGVPQMVVEWSAMTGYAPQLMPLQVLVSLCHTQREASAFVILQPSL